MTAELHLAENSLALHLLFQRLEGLIDIVIANENLHAASSFNWSDWNLAKQKVAKGRALNLERADVSDKTVNVHLRSGFLGQVKP